MHPFSEYGIFSLRLRITVFPLPGLRGGCPHCPLSRKPYPVLLTLTDPPSSPSISGTTPLGCSLNTFVTGSSMTVLPVIPICDCHLSIIVLVGYLSYLVSVSANEYSESHHCTQRVAGTQKSLRV